MYISPTIRDLHAVYVVFCSATVCPPELSSTDQVQLPLGRRCPTAFFFFFSSRRRHTRYWRDWSSDVCSSDLQVLPSIAAGNAMISYGLSEREAGSDAAAMRTRARLEGDTWVLNGTKAWITNSGVSEWYTVMAVTDPEKGANGISAFVVHRDDPGFAVGPKERKMGVKGSPTCELYLTDCTIPADRIIGEPGTGFKTALRTLDFTRPTIGAQAVGIAQGALDASVAYVKERRPFGKAISEFQGVQFMLADM